MRLKELEDEFNAAAKELHAARQEYNQAQIKKQRAIDKYREAKIAYLIEKEKLLGFHQNGVESL